MFKKETISIEVDEINTKNENANQEFEGKISKQINIHALIINIVFDDLIMINKTQN